MQHLIYAINPSTASDSICIYRFGFEDEPAKANWRGFRKEADLHFVLQGKGYVNGVKVQAGQGFYSPPGTAREYHSSNDDPWLYCWVDVSPELAARFLLPIMEPDKNSIFSCPYFGKVERIYRQLLDGPKAITQADAMYHLFSLLRLHQSQYATLGVKQELHVRKAKEYIEQHLFERLTVADVANAVFLHPQYLSTLFVQYERMTAKEYILHAKLYHACTLLLESRLQVKEIAQHLGFSDIYNFSKIFKTKIGMSPREYRANNR